MGVVLLPILAVIGLKLALKVAFWQRRQRLTKIVGLAQDKTLDWVENSLEKIPNPNKGNGGN